MIPYTPVTDTPIESQVPEQYRANLLATEFRRNFQRDPYGEVAQRAQSIIL